MLEQEILRKYRTIAVVGASPNPDRDSNVIAQYLIDNGYDVIPVNPNAGEVLGRKSYPSLSAVPRPVEVVDIFRDPAKVMPIVEDAIKIGAKAVWFQEGVINEAAAAKARRAGLLVVVDKCMAKEHAAMMKKGD
jgi:predicted CoA-binding protein